MHSHVNTNRSFCVRADTKTRTLACSLLREYVLREGTTETLLEKAPITEEHGFRRCMIDDKCREFALPYIQKGYVFTASLHSLTDY